MLTTLPRQGSTTRQSLLRRSRATAACFSSSICKYSYEDTIKNLRIGKDTRVMFQGFTGRQATTNAKESLVWGTNIVGGVTPGKNGEHLGKPVLPTMREAMEKLRPHATGIYVAAHQAPGAIEEAIEAEIPLIVAVAEHIPVHDLLRIHSILHSQSKSRLVGANSPGIISAIGKCRIGFQPLPCFMPGRVGIVAKSGTLSYEAVASTTRSGLGQSLCIGMGGDILAGTTFIDALKIFEDDPDTEGILLIGEIGGDAELEAAEWIKEYNKRSSNPKPIVAIIGGVNVPPGHVMGHAGAFRLPGDVDALSKIKALSSAGVTMVNHPSKFGDAMSGLLGRRGRASNSSSGGGGAAAAAAAASGSSSSQRRRSMHTMAEMRRPRPAPRRLRPTPATQQRRHIYIREDAALGLLRERGIDAAAECSGPGARRLLTVTIDRSVMAPCVIAAPAAAAAIAASDRTPSAAAAAADDDDGAYAGMRKFPFDYRAGPDDALVRAVAAHLQLSSSGSSSDGNSSSDGDDSKPAAAAGESLPKLLGALVGLFWEKEAVFLETRLVERLGKLKVTGARFGFDDAAFRSSRRQADVQALPRSGGAAAAAAAAASAATPTEKGEAGEGRRGKTNDDAAAAEAEAARDGIVYVRLGDNSDSDTDKGHNIGTLVNGAGLAMNTVDALADAGGKAANFLDTGGKATSETVKRSFQAILRDARVRVILVNIFGGLTRGDMIAEGVLLAFRELDMRLPVVVRIRGTNEEEGQRIIAESGLSLHSYDDFEEAAAKAIELANA